MNVSSESQLLQFFKKLLTDCLSASFLSQSCGQMDRDSNIYDFAMDGKRVNNNIFRLGSSNPYFFLNYFLIHVPKFVARRPSYQ